MIHVENISKKYYLQQNENSLFRQMFKGMRNVGRRYSQGNATTNEFWALKNISFDVREGEVLGIIGRNGAGKSTLLKILSRITTPTEGLIRVRGRMVSLLEVGTGFHPELSGRENIYLNGSILGMKKDYINKRFDEIVEFSEVEKFLDTPVKHYSSGMYVRLAFAVAAHLNPDILIVDEVLSVGDAGFQKKCLGKIEDIGSQGKTVLFVSHNLALVERLCNRAILLEDGLVADYGDARSIMKKYSDSLMTDKSLSMPCIIDQGKLDNNPHDGSARITTIELLDDTYRPVNVIKTGDPLIFRLHYHSEIKYRNPSFRIKINSSFTELIRLSTLPISGYFIDELQGTGYIDLKIDSLPLTGGDYSVDIGIAREKIEWICDYESVVRMHITARDVYHSGMELDNKRGFFTVSHDWNMVRESSVEAGADAG